MSRAAQLLIAAALVLVVAACNRDNVKPDLPGACAVAAPRIVYVDRYVYVRIKDALTEPEPIAEGPLSQCPDVAAKRKAALIRGNGKLKQIRAVEGTEVKP